MKQTKNIFIAFLFLIATACATYSFETILGSAYSLRTQLEKDNIDAYANQLVTGDEYLENFEKLKGFKKKLNTADILYVQGKEVEAMDSLERVIFALGILEDQLQKVTDETPVEVPNG